MLYSENELQRLHAHAEPRLSFLLAGELSETIEGRAFDIVGCSVGYKPTGARHEDRWGVNGALVLTLRMREAALLIPCETRPGWSPVSDRRALRELISLGFAAPDDAHFEESVVDLAALLPTAPPASQTIRPWVSQARDQIREEPGAMNVCAVAAQAGVHRTHFSRAFRQHYGLSPSEFRQRVRVARAISELAKSEAPLSAVAADAGFFDEAHMSRAIRSAVHLPPGRLRSALAHATSVQSRAPFSR